MLVSSCLALALWLPCAGSVETSSRPGDVLQRARDLIESGEPAAAAELLAPLLESGAAPTGFDARATRLLLARAHLAEGGRAQDALDVLAPLDTGDDHDVALALGEALHDRAFEAEARRGRGEDSMFLFELARAEWTKAAALATRGDVRAADRASALVLDVFGDAEAARDLADDALKRHGDDARLRLRRGTAALQVWWAAEQEGDETRTVRPSAQRTLVKQAVSDLESATEALTEDIDAAWQLAWIRELQGDTLEAVEAAALVLERGGLDLGGPLLFDLATRLAAAKETRAAGRALLHLGRVDPAFLTTELTRRSEADPSLAPRLLWVAVGLGNSRCSNGACVERNIVDALMASKPTGADVWNNYGFYLREAGEYETSYAAYEQALTFDDTDPRILNDTGVLLHYYLHRDRDRAVELYERAIDRAEKLLKNKQLAAPERSELKTALRDAKNNLSRLRNGDVRPR